MALKYLPELVLEGKRWLLKPAYIPQQAYKYEDFVGKVATLYIIGCEQYLKIGLTRKFETRFAGLDTANPFPVVKVAIRTVPLAGVAFAEAWLHQELAPYRVKGEWFAVDKAQALALLPAAIKRAKLFDEWCARYHREDQASVTDEDRARARAQIARIDAEIDISIANQYHERFAGREPPHLSPRSGGAA